MDIKKFAPWNWFKDEEREERGNLPVSRQRAGGMFPLSRFHEEIDRMFEDFLGGVGAFPQIGRDLSVLKPSVDIAVSEKEYTVTAEIPGVEEKDVKLELRENALIITGEKKHESEKKEKDFHRIERSYGSFKRVLNLPVDADADKVDASFKNGVLTVTLPRKAQEQPKGRSIEIKKAA